MIFAVGSAQFYFRNKFCLFFAISFALIFCCKYCVYFQYLFMHVVCANIFGANVLKPRFKTDVVIMIICSIVIIINSVFTLQVLTAKLPNDCGPCEIKAVFIHTRFASYRSLRLVAWGARTPKWPIKKGRESEHHFWGFPQVILSWSQSVPNRVPSREKN